MKNYIFGYGSLMEKESRTRTTPEADVVYPVKVHGFQRGWFARTGVSGLSTTFLGCIPDKEGQTNGVIYSVTEAELEETDAREKGYTRVKIELDNIEDYTGELSKGDSVWIYASEFKDNVIPPENFPSKGFPIVESYVDICVNGCLEIEADYPIAKEKDFAADFIRTTKYWNAFWVNDRIYPRRPFIYRKTAYKIDALLKEHLEDKSLFGEIYFE